MKILVIDDTHTHLKAALQTLEGHEVTICSSYDEAIKYLEEEHDEIEREKRGKQYISEGMEWMKAYRKARQETKLPYWDAVLCDLLMPASDEQCQGNKYAGQEMPIGWSLALVAAKRGAKYVAVLTDLSHHDHPASALLDRFNEHIFDVDGAKVLMTNFIRLVGILGTECSCKYCAGSGKRKAHDGREIDCFHCDGSGKDFARKGKDWAGVLNKLMGGDE